MADAKASERLILKILNGIQSGVEVSLSSGEYALGSGAEDDIQLIDVSLKPSHLRLRIDPGKIEIRAQAGSFQTVSGLHGGNGADDWSEVQPLEVITAGTTRFALGLPTAQWATVTYDDQITTNAPAAGSKAGPSRAAASSAAALSKARPLALPLIAVSVIVAVAGWLLLSDSSRKAGPAKGNELELTRNTIGQFPFAKAVTLRQDVDGTIYANGFVESLVERRAITEAIEKTGIPVRVRLQVLQVMRSELDSLIAAEKVKVTYTLPDTGVAVLDGTILNSGIADRFISRVKESIVGLNQVDIRIKTAKTLLDDIEKLARTTHIDQAVIFRLDKDVVEANGIIQPNKIDAWVGFLQAYARRYSRDISLRSFVQLQYDPNTPIAQRLTSSTGQPIIFGPDTKPEEFNVGDLFAGLADKDGAKPNSQSVPLAVLQQPGRGASGTSAREIQAPIKGLLNSSKDPGANAEGLSANDGQAKVPQQKTDSESKLDPGSALARALGLASGTAPSGTSSAASAAFKALVGEQDLGSLAESIMHKWLRGEGDKFGDALDTLTSEVLGLGRLGEKVTDINRRQFAQQYLPLLARKTSDRPEAQEACRPGSRLKAGSLPATLFWLDMLSTTDALNLTEFDTKTQGEILEAALDPMLVRKCLMRDKESTKLLQTSIYLTEASRNPDFVQYVTRAVPLYDMRITGASLSDLRYVQTQEGEKFREGMSPDKTSRIDVVGELGTAVQMSNGFSRVIYGPGINWLSQR